MERMTATAVRAIDWLIAIALFLMMAITVLDVIGRYVMNRPLPGSTELVQYTMVIAIFLALPIITARREHISVSLIDGALGERSLRVHRLVISLIAAAVLAMIGWRLWSHAAMLAENRDVIGYLRLPVAPAAFFASALAWVATAVMLVVVGREASGGALARGAGRAVD